MLLKRHLQIKLSFKIVEQRQQKQQLKLQENIFSIGKPNKNKILCIKNSFHGRTIAAIYASGSKKK